MENGLGARGKAAPGAKTKVGAAEAGPEAGPTGLGPDSREEDNAGGEAGPGALGQGSGKMPLPWTPSKANSPSPWRLVPELPSAYSSRSFPGFQSREGWESRDTTGESSRETEGRVTDIHVLG